MRNAVERRPRRPDGDVDLIMGMAGSLCPPGRLGEHKRMGYAVSAAISCLHNYRRECRVDAGKAYVETIPIRPVAKSGDGGGRFYWRLAMPGGGYKSVVKEGSTGTLQIARRAALEQYINGIEVLELVPPDVDPTGPDERQRNNAKQQEPGLTVRQREKKH